MAQALDILQNIYADTQTALHYKTPFELLVATMLSAQCTDNQVNKVTAELFKEYNTPEKMCRLTQEQLEKHIKSCGFYRNKAKNILAAAKEITEKHNGNVPDSVDELVRLPGVGRKTANVVVSNAFGRDAIAVDTHVFRVANRIGLSNAKTVHRTEMDLMGNIPKELWSQAHHWLIWHGRKICKARKPLCGDCPVNSFCEYVKRK